MHLASTSSGCDQPKLSFKDLKTAVTCDTSEIASNCHVTTAWQPLSVPAATGSQFLNDPQACTHDEALCVYPSVDMSGLRLLYVHMSQRTCILLRIGWVLS
jgi:hypothetical protein